jgi:uncharacterized protein YutE (UPF0331/DUF86 family)
LRAPQRYQEAIDILGENSVIPADFAHNFSKIASFRNFLAHDYDKIDYLKICSEALQKLDDVLQFVKHIEGHYQK